MCNQGNKSPVLWPFTSKELCEEEESDTLRILGAEALGSLVVQLRPVNEVSASKYSRLLSSSGLSVVHLAILASSLQLLKSSVRGGIWEMHVSDGLDAVPACFSPAIILDAL